jgi:tetratricopeptide (TPR) repeat protein
LSEATSSTIRRLLAALGISVVVATALAPGLGGELLNWDDDRFVTDNTLVHALTWENLRAIFGAPHQEAYHPLHLLSYTLDTALYGLWAPGFKLHNLALYLFSLLLLHRLLVRLGLPSAAAAAGVLLFALHPLHVEAVVWVSARKEPLSLCFMLGAALCYWRPQPRLVRLADSASASPPKPARARASSEPGWRSAWWWLSLALFCAALLTKTSTIILPLLLVAIDVLCRGRKLVKSLVSTAPFLALAVVVGLYVVGLWQENVMIRPRPEGAGGALALVFKSFGHHTAKLLVPVSLGPVYPIDRAGSFNALAALGLLVIGALGFFVFSPGLSARLGRLRGGASPLPSAPSAFRLGAAWFLVALLPVANIVPVYFFVQDRYAFVPSVALAIAAAALFHRLRERGLGKPAVAALAALSIVLALLSARQSAVWKTSLSLWRHAAAVQPESYYAHLALGHTLRRQGRSGEAAESYRRAVALQPSFPAARIALCLADVERRGADATPIEQALRRAWVSADALTRLAGEWVQAKQPTCAALAESRAFEVRPPDARARVAAASRWTAGGEAKMALRHLGRVSSPDSLPVGLRAAFHEVRAQALLLDGRRKEAERAFARSLSLAPRTSERLRQAARQLERLGRRDLARFYEETAGRNER